MTQKELLYYEDAIGHECNLVKILEETSNNLEDEKLIEYVNNEITIHQNICQNLKNMLEGKSNEWSIING